MKPETAATIRSAIAAFRLVEHWKPSMAPALADALERALADEAVTPSQPSEFMLYVSYSPANEEYTVFVPKSLDAVASVDVSFLERDDNAPDSYFKAHGVEHPDRTHDRLCEDDNYRRIDA